MSKVLVLKLGGECNLNCPHCHATPMNFKFNPLILDWIKEQGYKRITFSGGEPLMYFDLIKKIILHFGHQMEYKFMTNATLLTHDMVAFLNEYQVTVGYSFDGYDSTRDIGRPNLRALSLIENNTMSVTCYHSNIDLFKLKSDIDTFIERHELKQRPSLFANFVHQTVHSETDDTTREDAKEYCRQLALIIEPELLRLKAGSIRAGNFRHYCLTSYMALHQWWMPKQYKGLKCFNTSVQCMTIDGRFLCCPYSEDNVVGNIITGIDWDKVDALTPTKCKECSIFNICHGSCFANVSGNECYIAQTMNRWLNKVVERHGLHDIIINAFKECNDAVRDKNKRQNALLRQSGIELNG